MPARSVAAEMQSAWAKFLVVAACTLAWSDTPGSPAPWISALNTTFRNRTGAPNASGHASDPSAPANHTDVCVVPCPLLGASLRPDHIIAPCLIAFAAWLGVSLPTLLMHGRHRVAGLRHCLWPLLLLWLNLLISYHLFRYMRVWGYAWSLHACAQVLVTWSPGRQAAPLAAPLRGLAVAGAVAVCAFAWQSGLSASLIHWPTGAYSQCGGAGHLLAVLGVDLVLWALSPLRALVLG